MDNDHSISKYDRQRGNLEKIATFTRPSTVRTVQNLTGKAETFTIETGRHEELGGDFIFIECVDETGVTRLALPPRVANIIASQRERLTKKRRSVLSTKLAKERMARGEVPGFLRKKKAENVT